MKARCIGHVGSDAVQADARSRTPAPLAELESALGLADQLRLEEFDSRLGGQRLEEIAVELLRTDRQFGEAIHYREWFDLVRRAGHEIGGKDPKATFLAQLRRSQAVEAVGRRSGLYRLRIV